MTDDDEGWMAGLTPRASNLVDKIDVRHHRVDLERVQRIHLGLESEEMEFTALTVSNLLQDIADELSDDQAFVLRAFINALRGEDENHLLVLKQKRPGKFVSPSVASERHYRHMKWLSWVAYREREGVKIEATVNEIANKEGVGRATVFNGIKAAEEWLGVGRKLWPDSPNFGSPRLTKKLDD